MAENKIKIKSIGSVKIFEIFGIFSGNFASYGKKAMQRAIRSNTGKNALYNLESVEAIDAIGGEALINHAECLEKSAVLTKRDSIRNIICELDKQNRTKILCDEMGVLNYFGSEFANNALNLGYVPENRRQYLRLEVALPLTIRCKDQDNHVRRFYAAVSNLSEGGLYAIFIQSQTESDVFRIIDPYDLKLLDLELYLNDMQPLKLCGKVVRGDLNNGGIGIEFYGNDNLFRDEIKAWLYCHCKDYVNENDSN